MEKKFKVKDYPTDRFGIYDKETAEVIETGSDKISVSKPTKQVSISSKNYLYLDTDRLKILQENGISHFEIGLLVLMCTNLAFNSNVAMNDEGVPHTSSSIAEMIGQRQQSVRRKLKKLELKGVIKKTYIPGHKELGKVYAVNPYLLKRGKYFTDYLSRIFSDFVLELKDTGEPLMQQK